jgi:membrane associated rhomboid family serine protease
MILVIVNVAVFFLQAVLQKFTPLGQTDFFYTYLALSLEGLRHGYIWQILSYAFLHAGLMHLVFNLWAIYVFGNEVEQSLGRRSFVALYLGSAIIGAVFQAIAGVMFKDFAGSTVGASAAAFGLAAAFAMLFPDRILLLFFIIPVRAKYLLVIMGLLTLYGLMFPGGNIAHAAHLGGLLCGLAFVRYARDWTWTLPKFPSRRRIPKLVKIRSNSNSSAWPTKTARSTEQEDDEDFLSKEVDPILDKISASGIQSLTERERRILEQARAKMARR